MDLVELILQVVDYFGECIYSETIFMFEEDYESLGVNMDGVEVDVRELDEDYTKTIGKVMVIKRPKEEQRSCCFDCESDGDSLYYELCNKSGRDDIDEMFRSVNEYIEDLDSIVNVTFGINKSNVQKVKEFIDKLQFFSE